MNQTMNGCKSEPRPVTTQGRALVVDDTRAVREVISRFLGTLHLEVLQRPDGSGILDTAKDFSPDLIILDLMLPDVDGLSLLTSLKADPATKAIPVIMVSGYGEEEAITSALELGAHDYISKPLCIGRLRARVNSCLAAKKLADMEEAKRQMLETTNHDLEQQVARQLKQLDSSHVAIVFALSKLAESRDPETGDHLERLREYCRVMCEVLARNPKYCQVVDHQFTQDLYDASPLHDIGKVGIPDSILLKPGKLTNEEFDIMKSHSMIGAQTLEEVQDRYQDNRIVAMGIEIARSHHEKWNGRGYPDGLMGEQIPLSARILAVADVYDALTSKRVYKPAFSHEKSRDIIVGDKGTHFDPDVVDAFLEVEEKFRAIRIAFQ